MCETDAAVGSRLEQVGSALHLRLTLTLTLLLPLTPSLFLEPATVPACGCGVAPGCSGTVVHVFSLDRG